MKDSLTKIPATLTETKETIEIQKRSSDVKKVTDAVKSKPVTSEVLSEKKEDVHVPKKRDTEAVLKNEKLLKTKQKRSTDSDEEDDCEFQNLISTFLY
jgi:hypothetical protein